MALIWRETAIADLERIDAWLSQFENANPTAVRQRIVAAADELHSGDTSQTFVLDLPQRAGWKPAVPGFVRAFTGLSSI